METKELKEYLEKRIQKYEKKALRYKDIGSAGIATEDKAILRYIKSKEKKGVDYELLKKQLDEALAKETKESWNSFIDGTIDCKVSWYDGFMLDYTQEQLDNALLKIGAEVGDKVKVIVLKDD